MTTSDTTGSADLNGSADSRARTVDGMSAGEAVDLIEAASGVHPGLRRLHARGAVFVGLFEPTAEAAALTRAAHFHRPSTNVLVRFSNGAGDPAAPDVSPGVRGMAVRFLDGDRAVHDLVAANFPVFPSSTPEGFVTLVGLVARGAAGDPTVGADLAAFLREHPEAGPALAGFGSRPGPASAATARYEGLHAFWLVDGDGKRTVFRYRLVPEAGEVDLTEQQIAERDPHFLLPELTERLAAGPVRFALVFQLGADGDPVDDASQAWPDDRPQLTAGTSLSPRRPRPSGSTRCSTRPGWPTGSNCPTTPCCASGRMRTVCPPNAGSPATRTRPRRRLLRVGR
jgi:catalase